MVGDCKKSVIFLYMVMFAKNVFNFAYIVISTWCSMYMASYTAKSVIFCFTAASSPAPFCYKSTQDGWTVLFFMAAEWGKVHAEVIGNCKEMFF